MASPLRRAHVMGRSSVAGPAPEDRIGAHVPAAGAAPRLRVVGAPELVADDDHPDFAHLPRYRSR